MVLAEELTKTVDVVRSALPAPIFEAIARSIGDLQASGISGRAAKVGDRIELSNFEALDGSPLSLEDTIGKRPAVLLFYRGGWCPYCNVPLRAYAAALPEIEALGAGLVAITPELPDHALRTAEAAGVGFPIAIDKGNAFARTLGLVFTLPEDLRPLYREIGIDLASQNGDQSHELPIPALYVLDETRTVRWAFVEADFTQRADPRDVVAALRALKERAGAADGLAPLGA
ncbi:peroxiredoxin-like family protein [Rhizobium sp. YIM 134829]|uniref:peroxiredoxin-like family protein n=1 Tax=Rhizobium sp. YIM 134829 TaxID=3390453 RepID=UPI00397CC7D8